VKLSTAIPVSICKVSAISKRVVSTGNDFWTLPPGNCKRSLDSVYAEVGLGATGPELAGAMGSRGGARPSRSAFSLAALRRLSSCVALICARMRSFAACSSSFSFRFAAASLICSFFLKVFFDVLSFFRSLAPDCFISLVFFPFYISLPRPLARQFDSQLF